SVRGVSRALQYGRGCTQHQAGADRGRQIIPFQRVGTMARSDAALHLALHNDRRTPGDWPCAGGNDCSGIFPICHRSWPAHHERLTEFRHRWRVCFNFGHRPAWHWSDASRLRDRAALRPVETVAMLEQVLSRPVPAVRKPTVTRWSGTLVPRLITGLAIV